LYTFDTLDRDRSRKGGYSPSALTMQITMPYPGKAMPFKGLSQNGA